MLIDNQNDTTILKEELVNQIYLYPEKKVIVVHDINLKENFLIVEAYIFLQKTVIIFFL